MSDQAPPRLFYIAYPPEDVIACEICNSDDDEVREDARRQRGVFKAVTRRQNYVLHLSRQHDVPIENVKIRCSVCGRVSKKPSRTAWRDTQTHYRNRHVGKFEVQQVEGGEKVAVKAPLMLKGQDEKKAAAIRRRGDDVDDDEQKAKIVGGVVTQKFAPKIVDTGTIAAKLKSIFQKKMSVPSGPSRTQEPKVDLLSNKSTIISAMGQMFDIVEDNDSSQVLIHSTPEALRKFDSAKPSYVQKSSFEVSRIAPKTRPPIKRPLSNISEMPSPARKRFQPARLDFD